jgi:hypothetical protein
MTTPTPEPEDEQPRPPVRRPAKFEAGGIHNKVKQGMDPREPQRTKSFLDWLLRR